MSGKQDSGSFILSALRSHTSSFLSLPAWVQIIVFPTVFTAAWLLYNRLFRLRGIPGWTLACWGIQGESFWYATKLEWVWKLDELHKRYGSAVRIGPNHVDFSTPSAMHKIYAHGSHYQKPHAFYDAFVAIKGHPSIFSDCDPQSHALRRRAVSAAYAVNYLVKLEECVDPLVDKMIAQIASNLHRTTQVSKEGETKSGTFNFSSIAHFFAMDAVGELAFGKSFGFLDSLSDPKGFLRGVSNLSQWGGAIGYVPGFIQPWGTKFFSRLLNEPGGEVIPAATSSRVDQRYKLLAEGKEPNRADMLSKFVEAKHLNGAPFTRDQVLYTSTSVLAAGSDTSSLALSTTLRYLVMNPEKYAKAQAEVDEAFESGRLTEPCLYNSSVKLSYLQACIKETLRLHPPISMSIPRVVPPGGDTIDGRFYPGGTIVSVSPYIVHRNKAIWGEDAESFIPERWICETESERKDVERNFFAFGGGSRQCIGKNISLMELAKTLPRLLWHFHFTPSSSPSSSHGANKIGRSSDGTWSTSEPGRASSSWFLNYEDLHLSVSARRPAELDELVETFASRGHDGHDE